ncbi:MAG TPA: ABC transporter ATP-binding protein [Pseudogracilibacillus sp.]|nr:ABC transporter ATP-binding protein [Pseudogracilibacillus sp.]
MVDIKSLFKTYNKKTVIEDVSLQIPKGKITSFIGPNGAGKSTLISMISRLIAKDEGIISIDGEDVTNSKDSELARKISILKQSNTMGVKLTVRELISFGRFPYSKGRLKRFDWQKVDEAISYMELEELEDKYIDELSGGQRQRAYIAMVLAQDTEYILLDEPLNNLDMRHSVQIMKTLRRLVDELGKTIVIVIHDINFASCYSDEIVALKDGKIVKHGRTCDVIDRCVLKDIYDMDIDIKEIENQRICVYF